MNNPADSLSEQLSAFMDGELPEAEARFLRRRLEHDAELRSKWERLHLASGCMKGHPLRVMNSCALGTGFEGEAAAPAARARRPLVRWAMAASVAALALLFAPQLLRNDPSEPAGNLASTQAPTPDRVIASPASADLVALATPERGTEPRVEAASAPPSASTPDFIERNREASAKTSPMPLSMPSPADFPLVDGGQRRAWPRSELIGAQSDPTLEAYLVRHNQMLANDGMGGFVPYVDVVASDSAATAADSEAASPDAESSQP